MKQVILHFICCYPRTSSVYNSKLFFTTSFALFNLRIEPRLETTMGDKNLECALKVLSEKFGHENFKSPLQIEAVMAVVKGILVMLFHFGMITPTMFSLCFLIDIQEKGMYTYPCPLDQANRYATNCQL